MVNQTGKPSKPRKTARKTVTLQLVPGVDDDLIGVINTLPKGQQMPKIKRALRAALGFIVPDIDERSLDYTQQLQGISGQVAWLQSAMTDLRPYLDGLFSRGVIVQSSPFVPTAPTQDDEKARLAQEALDRRAQRINKGKWS